LSSSCIGAGVVLVVTVANGLGEGISSTTVRDEDGTIDVVTVDILVLGEIASPESSFSSPFLSLKEDGVLVLKISFSPVVVSFSGIGDGIVAGKGLNEGTCTTIDKDDKDEEDGSIAVPIDIPFLFSSASELGEGDGTCACESKSISGNKTFERDEEGVLLIIEGDGM
tara:strand:- start:29 stop:532 length:504 start_codon:yes stop_codon:yes gene_type:complete